MSPVAEPHTQRHRLTLQEYHRMREAGIFNEDAGIELIEGEIIDMTPVGSEHAGIVKQFLVLANLLHVQRRGLQMLANLTFQIGEFDGSLDVCLQAGDLGADFFLQGPALRSKRLSISLMPRGSRADCEKATKNRRHKYAYSDSPRLSMSRDSSSGEKSAWTKLSRP